MSLDVVHDDYTRMASAVAEQRAQHSSALRPTRGVVLDYTGAPTEWILRYRDANTGRGISHPSESTMRCTIVYFLQRGVEVPLPTISQVNLSY